MAGPQRTPRRINTSVANSPLTNRRGCQSSVSPSPNPRRRLFAASSPNSTLFDYSQQTLGRSQAGSQLQQQQQNSQQQNSQQQQQQPARPPVNLSVPTARMLQTPPHGLGARLENLPNWDEGDDEDHEDDEVQELEYVVKAPAGFSADEVQGVFDKSYYALDDNNPIFKRRYDTAKLDDEFGDGGVLWSALISSVRLLFCRFLHIENEWIPDIINKAAGREIDCNSRAYRKAHTRCIEWRKNWFSLYFTKVVALQSRIQDENRGYQALRGDDLHDAYSSHFAFENFYSLMGTTRAVVDWRETLRNPWMNALYKTIFTYSLVYTHRARHFPGELTKAEAMDNVRAIGLMAQFKRIGVDDLVLCPALPPTKVRHRKEKVKDILLRDETFVPYLVEEESSASPPPAGQGQGLFRELLEEEDVQE